ncbi:hypothetical protein KUTeg_011226 [Tegillarca granosa]|uniref:Uncharacterized protein n=1 Tax=Tegillarca granosa TaxID=220873 RepID=A0ABQ9F1D4_TEGGR|nr:hypothetical protein KUTeg_011226 [Tegillarca granosa]
MELMQPHFYKDHHLTRDSFFSSPYPNLNPNPDPNLVSIDQKIPMAGLWARVFPGEEEQRRPFTARPHLMKMPPRDASPIIYFNL